MDADKIKLTPELLTIHNELASLSGVGGGPAGLPMLTNDAWLCRCESVAQRNELLDYAANQGVPIYKHSYKYDSALALGWSIQDVMAYNEGEPDDGPLTSPDQFKAMCDAYAAAR